ncbi:MAG: sterol desaturase family protein [Bacteroidota bacterium]
MPELVNIPLLYYAIPFFVLFLLLELAIGVHQRRDWYVAKDTMSSLAMGIGNVVTGLLSKGLELGAYYFLYQFRLFDLGAEWWVWVLLFFAEDLTYYWYHRTAHHSRYFWASHVIHHSSQRYNLGTALRQTWTGIISGSFVFWLWLPLVGFHPIMLLMMKSVSLIYQFWIHTEAIDKLWTPIEFIFNTPSHHRVHHGSDLDYLDRNHAGILIIWDRLFGSFTEEQERPTYGLTKNIETYHPLKIATHEWSDLIRDQRQVLSWRERLGYLFGPPGWSHDGSRKTTKQLRREQQSANGAQ